jgi:hypothetical protein
VAIIYKIHYDNVGRAYIGSSLFEDPNYWGSMSDRGQGRIRDDHARAGLPIVRRREILWQGPADANLLSREYALITEHGTNLPDKGYNLMPMLPGVNIPLVFHWDKPRAVIHSTINCPYGVYTVHCNGEPEFWTTFTDLDGNTVEVYRGPYKSRAWNEYLVHKDKMVKLLRLDTPA